MALGDEIRKLGYKFTYNRVAPGGLDVVTSVLHFQLCVMGL